MVSPLLNPTACWEFEGEILVLHHPTTISTRYQAMGMSNHLFLIQLTIYTRPYGKRGGVPRLAVGTVLKTRWLRVRKQANKGIRPTGRSRGSHRVKS